MPIQYLQQELLPLLKDSNNFTDPATGIVNTRLMAYLDNWFDKLTGGGTNADKFRRLRLAACIAIDIKSGNFTAQDYLRVFQNFDSLPPEPENIQKLRRRLFKWYTSLLDSTSPSQEIAISPKCYKIP
jgi:hypothetical protein